MGLFDKSTKPMPSFAYRSEAFDYYFAKKICDGEDEIVAAEQAERFADIVAKNKKLPDAPPPQMSGLQKGVMYIKQIASIKEEHPEVWSLATGLLGGIVGGFTGGATASAMQEPPQESIDFDKL